MTGLRCITATQSDICSPVSAPWRRTPTPTSRRCTTRFNHTSRFRNETSELHSLTCSVFSFQPNIRHEDVDPHLKHLFMQICGNVTAVFMSQFLHGFTSCPQQTCFHIFQDSEISAFELQQILDKAVTQSKKSLTFHRIGPAGKSR